MEKTHVTAVMVTGKCPERIPLAISSVRAFAEQTYRASDLLIVNDGGSSLLEVVPGELLERLQGRVREVLLTPTDPPMALGALRNVGLSEASGEWLLQWDDDDWYHKDRITYQMKHSRPGCAQLLKWQVRYSFETDTAWLYHCDQGIAGSVLHPRTAGCYKAWRLAEDSRFIADCFSCNHHVLDNNVKTVPGPAVYLRFHHGSNTWDRKHIMKQFSNRKGKWALAPYDAKYLKSILSTHYSTIT